MDKSVNIVFIGGDERALTAARYLCRLGYEVGCCKVKGEMDGLAVRIESVDDALGFADAVILPIPVSRDGKTVLYSDGVLLSQITNGICADKETLVFAGMIPKAFKQELLDVGAAVIDYGADEKYLQRSAELTVFAFFDFIKERAFPALKNKKIAVCGLGRIGKGLVCSLCGQNTQINVLSSKADECRGKYPCNVHFYSYGQGAKALMDCDAVINTAPANVINMKALKSLPEDAIFYELASAPFGIDEDSASYLGKRYVKALGLPGIYYPTESGELIARTVLSEL